MLKLFGIILSIFCISATAEVYQWKDEKGVTHYGDKAPEETKIRSLDIQNNYSNGTTPTQYIPKKTPEAKTKLQGPHVIEIGNSNNQTGCTTHENGYMTSEKGWDAYQDYAWKNCHGMK